MSVGAGRLAAVAVGNGVGVALPAFPSAPHVAATPMIHEPWGGNEPYSAQAIGHLMTFFRPFLDDHDHYGHEVAAYSKGSWSPPEIAIEKETPRSPRQSGPRLRYSPTSLVASLVVISCPRRQALSHVVAGTSRRPQSMILAIAWRSRASTRTCWRWRRASAAPPHHATSCPRPSAAASAATSLSSA